MPSMVVPPHNHLDTSGTHSGHMSSEAATVPTTQNTYQYNQSQPSRGMSPASQLRQLARNKKYNAPTQAAYMPRSVTPSSPYRALSGEGQSRSRSAMGGYSRSRTPSMPYPSSRNAQSQGMDGGQQIRKSFVDGLQCGIDKYL